MIGLIYACIHFVIATCTQTPNSTSNRSKIMTGESSKTESTPFHMGEHDDLLLPAYTEQGGDQVPPAQNVEYVELGSIQTDPNIS